MSGAALAAEILDWLLLGDRYVAADREGLLARDVKFVVNATPEDEVANFFPEDFTYLRVPYQDKPSEDLQSEFLPVIKCLIDATPPAREHSRANLSGKPLKGIKSETSRATVLVHCSYGKSRSVALVLAFLMHAMRLNLVDAYNHVKAQRPEMNPNVGFMQQLVEFERAEFKGTVTFDLVKYYVSELKQMYKDTDVVVSDANALKALEACPVTELGLVDAMLWLEDNCRKQES